jgi:hypothetical protein
MSEGLFITSGLLTVSASIQREALVVQTTQLEITQTHKQTCESNQRSCRVYRIVRLVSCLHRQYKSNQIITAFHVT